jgi:formate dehydrogenase iron-sulfur subunit
VTSSAHTTPLERYLAEQADVTPVERFSAAHEAGATRVKGTWQDRIPLSRPLPGQQYAFDVDLDTCTGCKACVTACHNVNGLDDGESFRTVGLLKGATAPRRGVPAQPFQQTVTTACHHCVDPACLAGCPTNAYEKDDFTGIVAHIEGRCLGCGYCTWTCPYEVPRFNSARGVVRKCDMCRDRLGAGQDPGCVSACPNGAITITVVDTAAIGREAGVPGAVLVPTAPPSAITVPTTAYHSDWGLPGGLTAAGATLGSGGRSHEPLVAMLVLTQAAAGAFALDLLLGHRRPTLVLALVLGLVGLAASIMHLGRPERAWRALGGIRHSWLSREVATLGLFAALAGAAVVSGSHAVAAAAALAGAAGVTSSALLYAVTRRPSWALNLTGVRFALGSLVGGAAVALATGGGHPAAMVLVAGLVVKLAWESACVLRPFPLPAAGRVRFGLGAAAIVAALSVPGPVVAGLVLAAVLGGEFVERSSFFTDASWTGMPGPKT